MSQESFSAFKAKLAADEALRGEMARAIGPNATTKDVIEFARGRGYDFDPQEMAAELELGDDELDGVAGGLFCANGQHIKEATITVRKTGEG